MFRLAVAAVVVFTVPVAAEPPRFERDVKPILAAKCLKCHGADAAWRYRDWVIRALTADMPYDTFLREQIAGDEYGDYWAHYRNSKELPAAVVESLTATGFLRCASDTSRPDFVSIKNAPGYYYQTPADPAGAAVRLAFCRPARPDELAKLNRFLADQAKRHAPAADAKRRALADLCHMLLCANEFVYVD